jgi:glycosyltransferase involved in cell wall biosynthesis
VKILLYTDLTIRPDQLFWHRDLGLLTKAFRDLGHEAYLVVHLATEPAPPPAISNELDHPSEQPFEAQQGLPRLSEVGPHSEIRAQARLYPDPVGAATAGQNPPVAGALHSSDRYSESSVVGPLPTFVPSHVHTSATSSKIKNPKSSIQDDPVLWVSQQEVLDPLWWQSQKPNLVILGLWTRPKYDPVRRAALSATPRVIERADSDGMRTASCGLLTYAKRRFDYFRDRTFRWPFLLSIFASIFYSSTSILATPWIEYRLRKTLTLLPSVLIETPPATLLWKSLATRLGADPEKIHHVPHPIQTDIFKIDPTIPKKNQIISVGRWDSYQKNLPLLLKTLRSFLDKNPSWTSLVIGSGLPTKSPHPQITLLPPLPPPDLAQHMQDSKIFFSSSRYESFGLASAEAEACGCLVVGPSEIPALANFPSSENNFLFGSSSQRLLARLSHASSLRFNRSPILHPPSPSFSVAPQIILVCQMIT